MNHFDQSQGVIFRGEGPSASRTRIGKGERKKGRKKEREKEIDQKVAISIAGSYV